ncbi:FADR319Wp [Eremothecium gossypii FDAG1]|nr:FADR319Wp [Eremothecium gossypii FDAG1]
MSHTESDSDYSSSEESIQYVRPVFLHARGSGATSDEVTPAGMHASGETPSLGRPANMTKRFDFCNVHKVRFREPVMSPPVSQTPCGGPVTANLRAYGDVNGYQFLVTEDAYNLMSPTSDTEPTTPPTVHIPPSAPRPARASGRRRAMKEYWFGSRDVRIPVPTLPPLLDASKECVTAAGVRAFLTESSLLLQIPFQRLLKEQRVRWHPDRMQRICSSRGIVPDTNLITLVSQVINELWREYQSGQM